MTRNTSFDLERTTGAAVSQNTLQSKTASGTQLCGNVLLWIGCRSESGGGDGLGGRYSAQKAERGVHWGLVPVKCSLTLQLWPAGPEHTPISDLCPSKHCSRCAMNAHHLTAFQAKRKGASFPYQQQLMFLPSSWYTLYSIRTLIASNEHRE